VYLRPAWDERDRGLEFVFESFYCRVDADASLQRTLLEDKRRNETARGNGVGLGMWSEGEARRLSDSFHRRRDGEETACASKREKGMRMQNATGVAGVSTVRSFLDTTTAAASAAHSGILRRYIGQRHGRAR
jgi:hypothetical protein